jgi:hypothetical protein
MFITSREVLYDDSARLLHSSLRYDMLHHPLEMYCGARGKRQVCLFSAKSSVALQRRQYLWIQFQPCTVDVKRDNVGASATPVS